MVTTTCGWWPTGIAVTPSVSPSILASLSWSAIATQTKRSELTGAPRSCSISGGGGVPPSAPGGGGGRHCPNSEHVHPTGHSFDEKHWLAPPASELLVACASGTEPALLSSEPQPAASAASANVVAILAITGFPPPPAGRARSPHAQPTCRPAPLRHREVRALHSPRAAPDQ